MKYQYNFKEIFTNAKIFTTEYIFTRLVLRAVLSSLVASILILILSTPQFSISATLLENKDQQESSDLEGVFRSISQKDNEMFQKFRANVFSTTTSRELWELGWGSRLFDAENLYQDDNKIPKSHGMFNRFSALLLGYDLNPYYSHLDLKEFILRKVQIRQAPRASDFTVSMLTDGDREFAKELIYNIIITADSAAKQKALAVSRARIESAMNELQNPKNSLVNNGLSSILNSEYFKVASLSNDLPYYVYFVDMPSASEYPISPNAAAVFLADLIIFFILGVFFSYYSKNKEELW